MVVKRGPVGQRKSTTRPQALRKTSARRSCGGWERILSTKPLEAILREINEEPPNWARKRAEDARPGGGASEASGADGRRPPFLDNSEQIVCKTKSDFKTPLQQRVCELGQAKKTSHLISRELERNIDASRTRRLSMSQLEARKYECGLLRTCLDTALFRKDATDPESYWLLSEAETCDLRKICPVCAGRRAVRQAEKVYQKMMWYLSQNRSATLYLVTHTAPNYPQLLPCLDRIKWAISELWARRRKALNSPRNHSAMMNVAGGFHSFEIKIGKGSRLWHPHSHAVWVVDGRLDYEACRREWLSLMPDATNLDFRPLNSQRDLWRGELDYDQFLNEVRTDLLEVCKYVTKFSEASPAELYHIHDATRGKRLSQGYGFMKGAVPDDPDACDDQPDWDLVPHLTRFFRYHGNAIYHQETEQYKAAQKSRECEFADWNEGSEGFAASTFQNSF